MRVVLLLGLIVVAAAGGYGYFDLTTKLDRAETQNAEARNLLQLIRNEYASAPKVERHLNNHQMQIDQMRGEIGRIDRTYAVAVKVDAELAQIDKERAAARAGLTEIRNQLAGMNQNIHDARARLSNALSTLGSTLLRNKDYADAEYALRDCLAIREKIHPDLWNTFSAKSRLGAALLGQKKFAEAEPLLLQGYQGMKQREAKIPAAFKQVSLTDALERLVQLYDGWDKPGEAAKWKKKLEKK